MIDIKVVPINLQSFDKLIQYLDPLKLYCVNREENTVTPKVIQQEGIRNFLLHGRVNYNLINQGQNKA